ncbi:DUF2637 domain-containing protein [Kitasatospora sp. NPDC052896]|uniref:DUF2637 domain-containing protein n=1 Tax=Kitasatospora sp. NPDC052896 TaxID=3364061 RepID=UPI0037C98478
MTTAAISPAHTPSARVTVWDRLAVGLLGVLGFVLSYDALRQMAAATHVRGPLTYLFPVIIDGFIAYGVRALLVLRDAHWPARAYAWTLFAGATATSVWANALHAIRLNQLPTPSTGLKLSNTVVGVLSTLAPLALGGAVHLYILIARQGQNTAIRRGGQNVGPLSQPSAAPAAGDHGADVQPQHTEDRSEETALLTLLSAAGLLPAEWSDALPDPQPAEGDDQPIGTRHTAVGEQAESADTPEVTCVDGLASAVQGKAIGRPPGASMEQLMEVGLAAVAAEGRLTRAIVEQAVREADLPLGSTRLTKLMKQLRREWNGGQNRRHPEAD